MNCSFACVIKLNAQIEILNCGTSRLSDTIMSSLDYTIKNTITTATKNTDTNGSIK